MKLIVCVDDKNGLSFNHRRQSRDRVVAEKIAAITEGKTLWTSPYSVCLFQDLRVELRVCDEYIQCALPGDYVFVELQEPLPVLEKASSVYVFRWNRSYPQDRVFPMKLLEKKMKLISTEIFEGKSHPAITLEAYE